MGMGNRAVWALAVSLFVTACGGGGVDLPPGETTYAVGGTVSGLTGTVVLQNNGADDLTITQNGAFTFATAAANGAAYNVTVQSEPPNQNCSVTNGSGAVAGAQVTTIAVACANKTWANPSSLSDHISVAGQDARTPRIAMDNSGDAIIVWYQFDGANYQIYKSEYRDGIWTHPSSTSDHISVAGQNAQYQQVVMDDKGNAIITWSQIDGAKEQIYKSEYRNGSWTHPSSLNDHISIAGYNARNVQAAMDNNGNAIITWDAYDGAWWQIYKSEYHDGIWTHPTSTSDHISIAGTAAGTPQVAMDDKGNAIITWSQSDGADSQVYKSEYRGGIWTHPSSLNDHISVAGESANNPQPAMDGNGNAIITWWQYTGASWQIFESEYRDGGWTNPSSLDDHISIAGQDAYFPQIAMDKNGNAVIAWYQSDGANTQLYLSERRNGTWTNPSFLSDHISVAGQNVGSVQVAMDDNGNAVITWGQSDGATRQIYKSEYRSGGWINPSSLSEHISIAGQEAYAPVAAMNESGNAIITWMQSDGTFLQIYKSEYR